MNNDYLSIGEMAKMNHITVTTLRLYDELDLLKPVYVNPETNYRYYDIKQNARLDLIQYMKELQMNLKEIKELLDKEDINLIEAILIKKKQQLSIQINDLQRTKDAGIETAVVKKDDALIVKMLKERNIDFIVLAGYLAILTDELIDAYPNKIMNIHPSLIPSFCGPGMYGMHVHEAVLQRGAKVSGATVHFVSNIVDGGPIIKQVACDISDLDTADDIQKRVLEIEHKLLPEVVGLYCDNKIKIIDGKAKVI